jgi:hypothetical protein
VAKKELNLLQFAGGAAEPSTASTEIVLTPVLAANSLTACQTSFSVTASPHALPALLTRRKSFPRVNFGSLRPVVQQAMHPIRDGNGSNVTCLSAEVYYRPMPFALLRVAESQLGKFMPTESTGQQEGKQRMSCSGWRVQLPSVPQLE